ncbi:MAG: hypothetical protein O3C57_01105 [Verrucomicrobia bacterium]|nr:hypothetical protein [Verrucomicrobiota bacterium]
MHRRIGLVIVAMTFVITFVCFPGMTSFVNRGGILSRRVCFGFLEFFQVDLWCFKEVFNATLTAELEFLSFVFIGIRLAHFREQVP